MFLKRVIQISVFLIVSTLAVVMIVNYAEEQKFRQAFKAKLDPMLELLTDDSGKLILSERDVVHILEKQLCLQEEKSFGTGNVRLYLPHCEFTVDNRKFYVLLADSKGYGGWIKVMALFNRELDGSVHLWKIKVLEAKDETDGLGKNVLNEDFQSRFYNIPQSGLENGLKLDLEQFPPTFDEEEAKKQGFILVADVMSYATISAKAVANGIQAMYEYLRSLK
ncbi:FMN-binding protein [Fervidobacterium thailandense]|uniref:FMN-binding domain-containing protein n=1 Tax=Fervidobacterium thailandense TaxID=1008305 RepID=A0A1E3G2P5_9BACT|nr:FMN-binding protein [Fervidobacterium thailandense]ODN30507.1 hypothetical protein A4H02_04415 [Fervidobacterium thailandense]